ncbi:iron complex transport system substrate-binding protein [Amycolatopsis bartoniae]|uniref:ABC transporter substrate-binding protein n=1 Tax=Amycolatopsis bartoniae TaxID=941986 RepID=A0A8H9IZ01_9PSEU|nr:iron-siderophore ABC transporter substrate-binding protein [Amycolatopsis bartoniae]MBB2933787.1 iron complex transport system substrate-binding protein [Amycolatopsis bartoniae]TVT10553.1 iron-siderophore ABC transporter substrate-binding protein [Amycolatopsis bartoniae]GHF71730.1 ABC transporter substrate-binding protein [Amycolatopsis bartoniae]
MISSFPRRRAFLAGALASALLVVTGCGGSDDSAPSTSGGAANNGAYPVTITHKYGSTTIKSAPKRVVTVGLTDQDSLLALGVVPVGTTEFLGNYPGAIGPWAQDKLGNAAKPEVLTSTDGPQYEKIAALKPDLILGLYSALTQEQYDTLSKIAPVVAQPKEYSDYGIPWQEETRTVGKVLGKSAQAEQLVSDVEARFAKAKADNPSFAGATALVATIYQGYFVYGSEDPRSRVLAELGFTLPGDLDQVIGNKYGANISAERTDLLNVKALVWLVKSEAEGRASLDADKLYSGLDVAKQKREVLVPDGTDYGSAMSFVSVLSLPYLLDKLVPQLAAAVDGNPATS